MSISAFSWNAAEFLRLRKDLALFLEEWIRTGAELVLVGSAFLNKLTLFTMFARAGLFGLGGRNGFPVYDRLCSGIGSRKEHVMQQRGTCGLGP